MKIKYQTEINCPEWAITYLTYGDVDSLTEDDRNTVDNWLTAMALEGYTSPTFEFDFDSDKCGFYWNPEFGEATHCVYTHVIQFEG